MKCRSLAGILLIWGWALALGGAFTEVRAGAVTAEIFQNPSGVSDLSTAAEERGARLADQRSRVLGGAAVMLAANKAVDTPSRGGGPPGVMMAEALSTITGIAISPLLGVGAVGAWHYFQTPSEKRGRLSWYAQPWFWIPALILVSVCMAKDSLGPVVPTALKKPLDVAEVFENKFSALIATGALIPILGTVYRTFQSDAAFAGSGLAFIDGAQLFSILMAPVAFTAFVVVFLASHVINVLILISPFATVDAGLKVFRAFLLGTVTATSFASPKVGAIWSLVLVVLCYGLAGWSFRVFIFGTVFSWDIVSRRRHWFRPSGEAAWAFLSREVEKVPVRTFGKLTPREGGGLVFAYRPWLVLAERRLELTEGEWRVGRGVFHPEIQDRRDGEFETLFKLPPRYKGHEDLVAQACGLRGYEEIGLMAAWVWLKELFGFRSARNRVPA